MTGGFSYSKPNFSRINVAGQCSKKFFDSLPVSVEDGSGRCLIILAEAVGCDDVLEGVIHVAKGGRSFPYVGHPEALEADLKPAVMLSLRVSPRISMSSM